MHSEENDPGNIRENDDNTLLWIGLGVGAALLLGRLDFDFAPNVSPSGTLVIPPLPPWPGGGTLPPLPAQPAPVVAVNLPSPLRPARAISRHGGYGAPRYAIKLPVIGLRSSGTPFYPGQSIDHQHGGIDYPAARGEAVLAVEDGTLQAANAGPFGAPGAVALVASAPGGRRWAYVHVLPVGTLPREVKQGDWIATVGDNHLHLQLTVGGVLTDPSGFF